MSELQAYTFDRTKIGRPESFDPAYLAATERLTALAKQHVKAGPYLPDEFKPSIAWEYKQVQENQKRGGVSDAYELSKQEIHLAHAIISGDAEFLDAARDHYARCAMSTASGFGQKDEEDARAFMVRAEKRIAATLLGLTYHSPKDIEDAKKTLTKTGYRKPVITPRDFEDKDDVNQHEQERGAFRADLESRYPGVHPSSVRALAGFPDEPPTALPKPPRVTEADPKSPGLPDTNNPTP